MNNITLAIPYYDNPKMLSHHFGYWQDYPKDIADKILVILIDDGSPKYPVKDVIKGHKLPFEIKVYRIKQNIPWNFPGVRNLAFTVAPDGWVFSTDIDHIIPAESMKNLFSMILCTECYYVPARLWKGNLKKPEPMKRHGDSFILTRDMYWEVGGYDEDFAGHYGGSPFVFRRGLDKTGHRIELDNVWFLFFDIEAIEDACVMEWDRQKYHMSKVKKLVRKANLAGKYRPIHPLRFDWEQVA